MNRAARLGCIAFCLTALALLAGCFVPSVNALYEDSDTYYDDTLEGKWVADDGNSSMFFARNNSGSCYQITYDDNNGQSKFEGCLTHIGNLTFLDITAGEHTCAEAMETHLVPVHSFWRFEAGINTITLQTLDANWVKQKASKKRLGLAYVKSGDNIVLTASTAALRNFFKRYGESDEVFASKDTFHRQK